jgi:hypothetical protein
VRQPEASADTAFRQRFGNYAGLAEAELTTYRDVDDGEETPDPANSNTARTAPDEQETADIVVPFPGARTLNGAPSAIADRIAAALAAADQRQAGDDQRPVIGVELRRETATFHVPVSEASLPEALRKLAGGSLGVETRPLDVPAVPQLELSLPASADATSGR